MCKVCLILRENSADEKEWEIGWLEEHLGPKHDLNTIDICTKVNSLAAITEGSSVQFALPIWANSKC